MVSLFAAYFALLPFFFALPFFSGIDLALSRLLAALVFLAVLAWGLIRKKLFFNLSPATFFLSGFLAWASLSIFWSFEPSWALRKGLFLWSFLPLFGVLPLVLRIDREQRIIRAVLLGGGAAALIGIIQFFLQFPLGVSRLFHFWLADILPFFLGGNFGQAVASYPSLLVNISGATLMRASAFFPDPHIMAFYVGMLAPLALAFALSQGPPSRKLFFLISGLLVLADLLSFSRGGYVGLLLGAVFFTSLFFGRGNFQGKGKHVFAGVCVGLLFLAGIFFSPIGPRLLSSFSPADSSSIERLRLWEEATHHIAERPLLGTGLGNYPLLVKPSAGYREPIYAHNLFLDVAVETGLIGLFLFLGFFGSVLARLWKVWQQNRTLLALGLMTSLIVFLAHAFFETPLFSVHILPLLMLLGALALTLEEKKSHSL